MYNPNEASKPYLTLLKDKGLSSSIKSALFVIAWYLYNQYQMQQDIPILSMISVYFFFCLYFTFKPKLIRFLRGHLRGEEFRNKADD